MSVRTRDRSTDAYAKLRELIVRGRLAPGTRIIETDVADRLGISRTPVRAALQRLSQEGYVVSGSDGRRSRLSAAPLTLEDAEELFHIVGIIEGLAGRWTAGNPAGRDEAVADMRRINDAYRRRAYETRPDFNELFDLDEAFHRRYVVSGARPRLLGLHDSIKPQAERYIRVYISALTDQIPISVKEHQAIIEAIDAAEPEVAQRAIEQNWRNAAKRLSRVIEDVGERGSW